MGQAQGAAPPIANSTKLFYGVGAVAFGVKDNGFSYFLLLFYNQVMGLPASWVGAALMISLIVDGVVDPLIGNLSDNWRSKWGRRHPFMYLAAVPVAVAYAFLWNPPQDLSHPALFAYLLCTIIVVRMVIAIYEVPSAALVSELTDDYDQRTLLLGHRNFMGWCGGIIAVLLAYLVFLRPDAAHPVGQLNPVGYGKIGIAGGLLMLAAILISALGTHSRIPHLKQPPARPRPPLGQTLREMAATLSNRSLLMLLLAGMFSALALGLGTALNIYIMTYFWLLAPEQMFVLVVGLFVGAAAAFALAPRISRRLGKRNTAIILGIGYISISVLPVVLRLVGVFPTDASGLVLSILFATFCVSTACMVGSTIMTSSMLADVVEDSEVATGRRSEGLVFSANLFIQKCVSGIGVFGSGLVLSAVRFPEGVQPGAVDPMVLRNLAIVFVTVQAAFYLTAMAMIGGYRITREKHAANVALLAERRAASAGEDPAQHRRDVKRPDAGRVEVEVGRPV